MLPHMFGAFPNWCSTSSYVHNRPFQLSLVCYFATDSMQLLTWVLPQFLLECLLEPYCPRCIEEALLNVSSNNICYTKIYSWYVKGFAWENGMSFLSLSELRTNDVEGILPFAECKICTVEGHCHRFYMNGFHWKAVKSPPWRLDQFAWLSGSRTNGQACAVERGFHTW